MAELYPPAEFPVRPLVVIGPSGSGKSSIIGKLVEEGLININPSWTDRPSRQDEPEFEHRFVDTSELGRLAGIGFFLEVVQPFGLEYKYGLPALEYDPNKIPAAMLRAWFIKDFLKYYPDPVIYQIEAGQVEVEKVLRARGDKDLGTRLSGYEQEVNLGRELAHRVFCHELDGSFAVMQELVGALRQDFPSI